MFMEILDPSQITDNLDKIKDAYNSHFCTDFDNCSSSKEKLSFYFSTVRGPKFDPHIWKRSLTKKESVWNYFIISIFVNRNSEGRP